VIHFYGPIALLTSKNGTLLTLIWVNADGKGWRLVRGQGTPLATARPNRPRRCRQTEWRRFARLYYSAQLIALALSSTLCLPQSNSAPPSLIGRLAGKSKEGRSLFTSQISPANADESAASSETSREGRRLTP
jgi:hypothetical protein